MTNEELFNIKEDLQKLANEIDPQTGYEIEHSVLKSSYNKHLLLDAARIIDVLLKLDYNPTIPDKRRKYPFFLKDEDKRRIQLATTPITISAFTYRINDVVNAANMKKIKATQITTWLLSLGYLKEYVNPEQRTFKTSTEEGMKAGISTIMKTSKYGREYPVNYYNIAAQQLIVNHLSDIMEFSKTNGLSTY